MRYYSSEKDLASIRAGLKLMHCPHCKRQGTLVLHGHLCGYDDRGPVRRGRRIFCNNRKMSRGCGKTFSFLLADWIRGFTIFARCLAAYLEKIREGHNPHSAAKTSGLKMPISSVYRIHKRFVFNQSRIRTCLCRVKSPPPAIDTENSAIATINHLTNIFPHHCVTRFQHFFQQPFLI
jgi:transposase-like protein